MTAKEYLSQMKTINYQINVQQRMLSRLHEDMSSIRSSCFGEKVVSSSPESSSVAKIVEKAMELEQYLLEGICRRIELQHEIKRKISQITDSRYSTIRTDYYINARRSKEIAYDMGYDDAYVRRLKNDALEAFKAKFGDEF